MKGAIIGGGFAGVLAGGAVGVPAALAVASVAAPPLALAAGLLGGGMGMALGFGLVGGAMRRSFRRWSETVRHEADGLLDRLERGESLAPPPAPWRRSLQRRLRA